MSTKNSIDTIGNLTPDLPVCSAVLQPTEPPRAPSKENKKENSFCTHESVWEVESLSAVTIGTRRHFHKTAVYFQWKCSQNPLSRRFCGPENRYENFTAEINTVPCPCDELNPRSKRNKKICNECFLSHRSKLMKHDVLSFENITYAVQKSPLNGRKLSQLPREPTAC